jgi:SAM-dependent methyltransferase
MDWSEGRYEQIALGLQPAAVTLIEHAQPRRGERVVDVGCGTGNGTLLAAERGARATGVDPAARLLTVAQDTAHERGLDANFVSGTADMLPFLNDAADLVISVFGIIFAPDAPAAAAEAARITKPGGRMVLSAWIPAGAFPQLMRIRAQALADAVAGGEPATPPPPPPTAWHDRDTLTQLFAPHGFTVEAHDHGLPITAGSPEEFLDGEIRDHPSWIDTARQLNDQDALEPLRECLLEVLRDANEDSDAFRMTSPYVVAIATHQH